ncbi:MAG TPA: MauE/DoxX family redox-associated membrane protein [Ktedonobacteraceae bacterium]
MQDFLQVAVLLMRAVLAAVLVAAGAAKLADTRSFALTLRGIGLPVRPPWLVRGLALATPLLELGSGLAAISGLWPQLISGVMLVLMCGFSLVVVVALSRRLNVTCRCFGTLSDSQFSGRGLLRSLLLTLCAALVFVGEQAGLARVNGGGLGMNLLLVAGFLLFALAAAQAAKTLAILKESAS